jgi:dolichyl-phosphate beta-glucosyltransferase
VLRSDGSRPPFLSVIIPAFNEAARIGPSFRRLVAYLQAQPYLAEVLVISDGSDDGTGHAVQLLAEALHGVVVLENGVNRGKGFSVRRGMLQSRGDVALFCDADGSTPIEELGKLLTALDNGYDVAIGSRGLPESQVRVSQPVWRRSMGRVFNGIVQRCALPGIHDTQCGFKCFTRDAIRQIFPRQRIERFGFDVELLWLARKLGYRIAEVPVAWVNHPRSTVHPVRDSSRMLLDVVRVRVNDARGNYGAVCGRTTVAGVPHTAIPRQNRLTVRS